MLNINIWTRNRFSLSYCAESWSSQLKWCSIMAVFIIHCVGVPTHFRSGRADPRVLGIFIQALWRPKTDGYDPFVFGPLKLYTRTSYATSRLYARKRYTEYRGENNDVYSFLSFKKQKNGAKIDWRREHKILVQHEKCRMWERNGTLLGDVKCWQHSCMTKVLPKIYAIFRSPAESISFYIVFTDAIVWQAQTHIFSRSHSIYIAF